MQFGEDSELLCVVSGISCLASGASCHCEAALRHFFLCALSPSECAWVPPVLCKALHLVESNGKWKQDPMLGAGRWWGGMLWNTACCAAFGDHV